MIADHLRQLPTTLCEDRDLKQYVMTKFKCSLSTYFRAKRLALNSQLLNFHELIRKLEGTCDFKFDHFSQQKGLDLPRILFIQTKSMKYAYEQCGRLIYLDWVFGVIKEPVELNHDVQPNQAPKIKENKKGQFIVGILSGFSPSQRLCVFGFCVFAATNKQSTADFLHYFFEANKGRKCETMVSSEQSGLEVNI